MHPVSADRTLGVLRPVEYSKVPVRDICDRTHPVSGDRTLPASGQHLITGVWVELTGASGHPTEAHNSSFFRLSYKKKLHSCVESLLLISTAKTHLRECQEQGPSEVIEI